MVVDPYFYNFKIRWINREIIVNFGAYFESNSWYFQWQVGFSMTSDGIKRLHFLTNESVNFIEK